MSSQPPYSQYNPPPYEPYPQNNPSPLPANPYPSLGYQQYYPQPQQGYAPSSIAEPGRGAALAGLILGLVGFIFPIAAIAGLITSMIGLRSVSRKEMAIAGLIVSSIALALYACIFIFAVISAATQPY